MEKDSLAALAPNLKQDSPSTRSQKPSRIPAVTYRFQLRGDFGFENVTSLLDYLTKLGISDLYLSPLFHSRSESTHGYDVVDHSHIEPTFGSESQFREMATAARSRDLGILLDLVPNHMGINDRANTLWKDVLENGPVALAAQWFDIEWEPEGGSLKNQVLLPFLGKPFGECLEAGEISLVLEDSRFAIAYYESRFPVSPPTWTSIISLAIEHLRDDTPHADLTELKSIATQLRRLPEANDRGVEATEERYQEQAVVQRRLDALLKQSSRVREAIARSIDEFNGKPGVPGSWDRLEDLLSRQHYRLAFWRVAVDEINYRRFFDMNDLAAIRVENKVVFDAVHALTFQLIAEGLVTGVRIDHPDGLLDPLEYFRELQANFRKVCKADNAGDQTSQTLQPIAQSDSNTHLYIVAEKILSGDEKLPVQWPIAGTTGYDFLNDLNGLLVDPHGVEQIQAVYPRLSDNHLRPRDTIYDGKLTILRDSMSSELAMIASRLFNISKISRRSRDFTLPALRRALREVIACFSVYRTYVQSYGWDIAANDHRRVMEAIRWVKKRNRTMNWDILDYIASILLLEFPSHLSDDLKPLWRKFAVRFQQITGPITAKGVEDTAFYRYYPIASLNEVGAELGSCGLSIEEFNLKMHARAMDWPYALSATGTHDMKRGEDVRARLNVLSEIPVRWEDMVQQCHEASEPLLQEVDGDFVPNKNERYLIYQTLLGTWPIDKTDATQWIEYTDRIKNYCVKAIREAKQNSSWTNPSESYENALAAFLDRCLQDREARPLQPVEAIAKDIAAAGFVNSISQVVLKTTLPGVPDFYQGSEFWDFRLVDPDNRKPVDFKRRADALDRIQSEYQVDKKQLMHRLTQTWSDDLKLFATWRALESRARHKALFENGEYFPLSFEGPLEKHLFGFARRHENQWVMVLTARHARLLNHQNDEQLDAVAIPASFVGSLWDSTHVLLPSDAPTHWQCEIASQNLSSIDQKIAIKDVFCSLFVSILYGTQ